VEQQLPAELNANPSFREMHAARCDGGWAKRNGDPILRAENSERIKRRRGDPKFQAAMVASLRDLAFRVAQSERAKKFWVKRRAEKEQHPAEWGIEMGNVPASDSSTALQDGMLEYFKGSTASSDANIEKRIEKEPFTQLNELLKAMPEFKDKRWAHFRKWTMNANRELVLA
jgi:hypothetical protein